MRIRQKHIEVSEWKKRSKFTQDELKQYLLEQKLILLGQGKVSFELNLDSIRISKTLENQVCYRVKIIEHHKAKHLRREYPHDDYSSVNRLFDDIYETYKYKCVDFIE